MSIELYFHADNCAAHQKFNSAFAKELRAHIMEATLVFHFSFYFKVKEWQVPFKVGTRCLYVFYCFGWHSRVIVLDGTIGCVFCKFMVLVDFY